MMYGTVLLRTSGVKSRLILYGRVRFEVGLFKGDFSHFILEKNKKNDINIVQDSLDPGPHQSEKQDQDPDSHQSENVEALEGHFRALEGPNLGKSER
jgi:hypothetical protein